MPSEGSFFPVLGDLLLKMRESNQVKNLSGFLNQQQTNKSTSNFSSQNGIFKALKMNFLLSEILA